jgi:hypothetical protein
MRIQRERSWWNFLSYIPIRRLIGLRKKKRTSAAEAVTRARDLRHG